MTPRFFIFLMICGACTLPLATQAAGRSTTAVWAGDLNERLDDFQDSVVHLQDSNAAIAAQNKGLKERLAQGQSTLEALKLAYSRLQQQADFYASKTEKKSGQLTEAGTKVKAIEDQMHTLDGQIAQKQKTLEERQRRQKLVWRQLGLIKDRRDLEESNERRPQALQIVVKNTLLHRLEESRKHQEDLESQIAFQSMLRMDPAVSAANLKTQREQLKQKLASLPGATPSVTASAKADAEAQKLSKEIAELQHRRIEKINLLQMLKTQYDNSGPSAKHAIEERKLQASINALKKDNELLTIQSAELQAQMVELDKRKAYLERSVNKGKRP